MNVEFLTETVYVWERDVNGGEIFKMQSVSH